MKIIKSKIFKKNNIYISNNIIYIKNFFKSKKFLILDYNVFFLFFNIILNLKNFLFLIIPIGENTKNINLLKIIWKYMILYKINKSIKIISFGGGVIGDIIGFVSAVYFRGINFCLVPTSFLSQIDSSIGGKNGINFFSKNTIGVINFPLFIYINYSIIFYMNKKTLKDGYSEMIKYSLINNKKLFFFFYRNKNIKKKIIRCCYIKVKIISQDYNEKNIRSSLNFGHTFGHVIENNKIKFLTHGKSIIIGMVFSIFISLIFYKINTFIIKKIFLFFLKNNFKILNNLKFSNLMIKKTFLDKKFLNNINYILLKKIGFCIQKILKIKLYIKILKKFHELKINNKMA